MAGPPSGNREPVGPTHREAIERSGHPVLGRRQDATAPLAVSIGDAAKMLGNGAAVLAEVATALAHLAYEAAGVNDVESSGPAALAPASLAHTVGPLRPQPALVDASTAATLLGISVAAPAQARAEGSPPAGRRLLFWPALLLSAEIACFSRSRRVRSESCRERYGAAGFR